MRNLIFLLIVLAIGVGVLGYYQGWFQVSVDKAKIQQDTEKAKDKLNDVKNQATQKTRESGEKDKQPADKP